VRRTAIAFFLFVSVAPFCRAACGAALPRPASVSSSHGVQRKFARKLTVKGLPNLGEVTPTLYRGSQPTKEGFEQLARMHIAIVVDLRGNRTSERDAVAGLGMRYVPIPWFCMRPKNVVIAQFLILLRDNPGKKVFVHCNTGIDRTGMMVAAYRMAIEKWTADEAMGEMRAYGFSRFHRTICLGLSSYERRFPREFASDPVFEALRTKRIGRSNVKMKGADNVAVCTGQPQSSEGLDRNFGYGRLAGQHSQVEVLRSTLLGGR
jgi:tyrosine-protein phosphatase SIW14